MPSSWKSGYASWEGRRPALLLLLFSYRQSLLGGYLSRIQLVEPEHASPLVFRTDVNDATHVQVGDAPFCPIGR